MENVPSTILLGVMEITTQDLGSIGEFVASIGVIVSLVYLAVQTKSNTRAIRAQTRSSITDQVLTVQSLMFDSDEYRRAFAKYARNETLDPSERDLLDREALLFFKHMENAQFQYESGLYDSGEYEAQRRIWIKRFRVHSYWRDAWEFYKDTLSPRLVAEVQPIVDKATKSNESANA